MLLDADLDELVDRVRRGPVREVSPFIVDGFDDSGLDGNRRVVQQMKGPGLAVPGRIEGDCDELHA